MKFLFWGKARKGVEQAQKRTPTQLYKGINANCVKHAAVARCMCNRCLACIEDETGMTWGALTYGADPGGGLLLCNYCLSKYSDEELAEYYAMFSSTYWHRPVTKETVQATLIKKPSRSTVKRYVEGCKHITEITDQDTGNISRSISE